MMNICKNCNNIMNCINNHKRFTKYKCNACNIIYDYCVGTLILVDYKKQFIFIDYSEQQIEFPMDNLTICYHMMNKETQNIINNRKILSINDILNLKEKLIKYINIL